MKDVGFTQHTLDLIRSQQELETKAVYVDDLILNRESTESMSQLNLVLTRRYKMKDMG